MPNSKCVVIFSGGLDSTVILQYCIKQYSEVYCITYNYNQRHKIEIDRALDYTSDIGVGEGQIIKQHFVVDLGFYSELANSSALTNLDIEVPKMKDVVGEAQNTAHVPNRNSVMLNIAAGLAESINAREIFYGAAKVDNISGHWDGTKEFLEKINDTLALNRQTQIRVKAPLMELEKFQIITWGLNLGVDFSKTYTCYNGKELACGTCPACSSRIQGFIDAKLIDPVKYSVQIPWSTFGIE